MDELAIRMVKESFQRFQTVIKVRTADNLNNVIQQAISLNPTITYYIQSCGAGVSLDGYEIYVQYTHKDTDRSDVKIVKTQAECEQMMCRFVGQYKKKLVVVARIGMDLGGPIRAFQEKNASFYPNLTSLKVNNYHFGNQYAIYELEFEYRIGRVKLVQMEQDVSGEVERISRMLFKQNMPNDVKIYLAHNYLATTVKYVNANDNRLDTSYTQSAYGALIKKQCVCQGFAEAFKRLMDAVKIECYMIHGQVMGSTSLHAWNIVSVGNGSGYFHIDVTWDSTDGRPGYLYFCKNDAYFIGKRLWNREHYPRCNGIYPALSMARKYVFLNRHKLISEGIDPKVID